MADEFFAVAFLCLLATFVGSGCVFVIWTIVSSLTTRVAKPSEEGFKFALAWATSAWAVTTIPIIFLASDSHLSMLTVLLITAGVSALCSVGGACYGNGK